MSINPFDDAVEHLDEQSPALPPAPVNPFDETVKRVLGAGETRMRRAIIDTADVNPDAAAEARRIALKTGVPADVVQRNLDTYRQREQLAHPYAAMQAETPKLASWIETPANHAIAKDDLENLGVLEWLVTAPQRAFAAAINTQRYSQLRLKQILGGALTQEEHDQLESYRYHMEADNPTATRWFQKPVTGLGSFVAQQGPAAKYGAVGATGGAVAGGLFGLLAGGVGAAPGALAGGLLGARVGVLVGVGESTFVQETASAADEFERFHDEFGRRLDPGVVRVAALAAGLINAPIEMGAQELLLRSIPGFGKAVNVTTGAVRAGILQALKSPTVRAALADVAKSYGTVIAGETSQEVAQRAFTILSGEFAKTTVPADQRTGTLAPRGAGDVAADLAREGAEAFLSFSLAVLPMPMLSSVQKVRRARAAQHNVELFTALGEGVTNSKTMARMPEAVQAFLAHATKDGPIEQVYAPVETWTTYWQEKGQDPAAIAAEVTGSRDAYAQAIQTGEDLAIPTARYATKLAGTAHNTYFAQEIRLQPGEMNGREAKAFLEQLQQQTTDEASAETRQSAVDSPIRQALVAQLIDAGLSATTADSYAQLHESVVGNLADVLELTPEALAARYGLQVRREGEAAASAETAPEAPVESAAARFAAITAPLTPEEVATLDRRQGQTPEPPGGVERRSDANAAALAELQAETMGRDVGAGGGQQTLAALLRDPTLAARATEMRRAALEPKPTAEDRPFAALSDADLKAELEAAAFGALDLRTQRARGDAPADVDARIAAAEARAEQLRDEVTRREDEADAVVDTGVAAEQTTADDVRAERAGARAGEVGRPAYRRIEDSTPNLSETDEQAARRRARDAERTAAGKPLSRSTRREGVKARAVRRAAHYNSIFAQLLEHARALDPDVDEAGLRTEFDDRVEMIETLDQEFAESGEDPRTLLEAIAALGGIGAHEIVSVPSAGSYRDVRRYSGELQDRIRESTALGPFGSFAGVRGVFQTPGRTIDDLLTSLTQDDQRFAYLTSHDALYDALEDIARLGDVGPRDVVVFPGTETLRRRAGIDPAVEWWKPLDERTFEQGLFDEEESPADLLDTGEVQPRLPGDVGDVREREIATPEMEAPFSLTAEIAPRKGKQGALFQLRRGRIRFGAQGVDITLFANADLSTLLHEFGHLYLEMAFDANAELVERDPTALTARQKQLLADVGALMEWLGVERREDVGRAQHEQFARSFEAYLMQGEAPSIALRGAFARFRAWLVGIYRHVKALSVELDARIVRVMDRLVATDEAIALAESQGRMTPMFLDAKTAGMSEREFAAYRSTIEDASRQAQETLQTKLLADVQREQEASYQARREEVRAEVAREIHQRREFVALAAIQRGTSPEGDSLTPDTESPTPLKLSRQAIVDQFGKARLKTLPRPYVYTAEGGLDPAAAAELFGFSSADELLTALATAGRMDVAIDVETDRRMIAEHGSILLDGTLAERAQAAVAHESRDKVIRAEMKALVNLRRTVAPHVAAATREAKREQAYERRWLEAEAQLRIAIAEGRKQAEIEALEEEIDVLKHRAANGPAILHAAIPPSGVITTAARTRIGAMRVRDMHPERFWAAARQASRRAIERAAAQDFDGAIQAQQQQLLNLALYREAERALDDTETRVRQAKQYGTPAARARIGKAGETFLEQIDAILERYEFVPLTRKAVAKRAELRKWVAAMEGEGLSVELPDELLEDARRVHYSELTFDELVGVTDGLKQIAHLARVTLSRLQSAKAEDFAETRDAIVDAITTHGAARPTKLELLPKDRPARLMGEWFASHTKLSQFVAALDGYVDGGPVWDAIMRPVNEAATAQQAMHETAAAALKQLITEHYSGRELAHFHDALFIPAIGDSLSREGRLAVALNWGNLDNRQRLMERVTRRWTESQVQAILDTLDERDLRFVQASLDYVNTWWPQIAAKQRRVFGVAPEKVEAASWHHAIYGEQRGGYYPIAYDRRVSVRQGNMIDADAASLQKRANYGYATTKRGHTKAREERVNVAVRLELSVMYEHVESVIHDLTHHEMLIDVGRLLGDRKVQDAIASRQGDIVYRQIRNAMLDIALGTEHATQVTDRALNWVKNGTTIAGLGWNVWTALQQPLGVFNAMARIGPTWVARGLTRLLRDASTMESSARWVHAQSEMMRLRHSTMQREIQDLRATLKRSGSWFDNALRTVSGDRLEQEDITESFLFLIGKAQQLADLPTWIGGYEKARAAGETEARAIAMADQVVLDAQSGGQIKDLASVQRGAPVFRLFTTFYSYGNLVFNQTARALGQTNFRRVGSVGQLLGNLTLIYVAPAAMTVALSRAVGRDDDDDDRFVELLGRELLASTMNTMVLVRELAGAGQMAYAKATGTRPTGGARGYEGPTGLRIVSSLGRLVQQAQQGEADRALLRAAEDVAGVLFHLPLAQVQRSVDGAAALIDGRTTNPAALLVGAPPKKASGQ